jgi:hypothetical protein
MQFYEYIRTILPTPYKKKHAQNYGKSTSWKVPETTNRWQMNLWTSSVCNIHITKLSHLSLAFNPREVINIPPKLIHASNCVATDYHRLTYLNYDPCSQPQITWYSSRHTQLNPFRIMGGSSGINALVARIEARKNATFRPCECRRTYMICATSGVVVGEDWINGM